MEQHQCRGARYISSVAPTHEQVVPRPFACYVTREATIATWHTLLSSSLLCASRGHFKLSLFLCFSAPAKSQHPQPPRRVKQNDPNAKKRNGTLKTESRHQTLSCHIKKDYRFQPMFRYRGLIVSFAGERVNAELKPLASQLRAEDEYKRM